MPETAPRPDGPPTLRDRIAEAMRAHYIGDQTTAMGEHLCVCGEWADGTDTDDWDVHLADAVMHVIEHDILAVQVDATQRADELAARLQGAEAEIERLRGDLKWTRSECAKADAENRALAKRAEQAERRRDEALAAVQRVRDVHNGGSAENAVLCVACCAVLPCPTLAALDQPEETPDA